MSKIFIRGLCLVTILALSACGSLPRGAALQKEVLRNADEETAPFQVVQVTRASAPVLKTWPATGWHGHYHWIEASSGSNSSVIQAGDTVDLTIWDNQVNSLITSPNSNSVEMRGVSVSSAGAVFVPYAGDVFVRGLTPDSARKRIQEKLSPIAPDAQVQLSLAQGAQNSFSAVAGLGRPGTFPLPDRNTSILAGIAQAGGITPSLNNPIVTLVRGGSTYSIPAQDLFASANKNTRLRGGDKILVEEDIRSFTALGASGSETIVSFPKEHIHALEALSLIGGINDTRADPKGVLILREYKNSSLNKTALGPTHTQVVFSIDLTSAEGLFAARNFRINPNDTVLATESPLTAINTVFGIIGSVFGLSSTIQAAAQ